MDANLYVGTSGLSVWFSRDKGETWTRPYSESGLYLESRVWALSAHPDLPGQVFAGTDSGVYRWDEGAKKWTRLAELDGACVWSLAHDPRNGRAMLAGTHPAALWRSDDAGATWRRLPCAFAESCIFIGRPRVTQVLFDPDEAGVLWAGAEIDGVYRSADGGETWERRSSGLISDDIHGLAVVQADGARRIFAATNKGLHVSEDEGRSWRLQLLDSPWQYTRAVLPGPLRDGTVWLTNGNGPPGSTGRLLLSRDGGRTFRDAGLPGELNSTPWCVATNAADPELIFVLTNLGQAFRSEDGGRTWTKLKREFGEVRSALWLPAL